MRARGVKDLGQDMSYLSHKPGSGIPVLGSRPLAFPHLGPRVRPRFLGEIQTREQVLTVSEKSPCRWEEQESQGETPTSLKGPVVQVEGGWGGSRPRRQAGLA